MGMRCEQPAAPFAKRVMGVAGELELAKRIQQRSVTDICLVEVEACEQVRFAFTVSPVTRHNRLAVKEVMVAMMSSTLLSVPPLAAGHVDHH